ncbi:MAG: glutamine amidotransferase [Paracoccaceae bacterium]|nr:MAG: glutamine amidotransferase [Paracoccaceae bacterium]
MLRIGLFETGKVPDSLRARHGDYPAMFRAMFARAAPEAQFVVVRTCEGEQPADLRDADGWVITGSRHGVYDDLSWIAPFRDTLRRCRDAGVPLAGICFGHQIMAEAFGGRAGKAPQGWGLGLQRYRYVARPGWMGAVGEGFDALAIHQDQVSAQPPGTTLLAASAHCPIAALAYGDPERPEALSVQAHPEFTPAFLDDLMVERRGKALPADLVDAARESLSRPVAGADWAGWIADLFRARQRG